ncbi:MAG: hypothetical protein ABIW79_00300 [Gemmatimonas sp.]
MEEPMNQGVKHWNAKRNVSAEQPTTAEKPPRQNPKIRGQRHWNVKLTPEMVREIRASEVENRILAITYGISSKAVSEIKNRKSWRWLE